jgi:hypothetical protein
VFICENITNCWDWEKQYSRGDETSNILIRCISILSAYLGSKIHIDYKYKMSDWEGLSASGLSKKNRHIQNEEESCMKMEKLKIAPAFLDWMKSPRPDWNLPKNLAIWLV